jgi:hypothetical protein
MAGAKAQEMLRFGTAEAVPRYKACSFMVFGVWKLGFAEVDFGIRV